MDMTADQTLQESCMGALRHMGVEVTALVDKANRLKAENAKLRELVKHYANEVYEIGCLGCPYFDEYQDKCGPYKLYPYTDGCRLLDDMRELKIEVPHD